MKTGQDRNEEGNVNFLDWIKMEAQHTQTSENQWKQF